MMSLFGKKKIIGLDIGTSSIKIAELDVGRKGASLVAFGIVPTPPNSFMGGDITDTHAVGEAIKRLVAQIKSKRKNVATGLGGTSVIVKKINIPKMDEKLIPEQIKWEADQYIPYDSNEVNRGYEILKHTGAPAETLDILLIAAVQSHVYKYAEAISLAGLECSIVDVSGLSLANCFRANYGKMEGQTIALLNIGAAATTMVVVENSETVFCRDIPVGGLHYTMDLQKGLNVTLEEAESIKLSYSQGKDFPAEAASVIEGSHNIVVEEIKASFDFFLNSAQNTSLSRCFVTGGGARITGLVDRLSKIVPCEKFDPFFSIRADSKSFSREYLSQIRDFSPIAIGLGLRQMGDDE